MAAAQSLAHAHRTSLSTFEIAELGELPGSDLGEPPSPNSSTTARGPPAIDLELVSRHERANRFRAEAAEVASAVLRPVSGLLRVLGLSGSTVYGAPDPDDDLDFVVVVRRGGVWPFLLYAWAANRWKRRDRPGGSRGWCFNLVLDEREAAREFGRPRGFLVARDALRVEALLGEAYYRQLLGSAPWIGAELPIPYERRATRPAESPAADPPLPTVVRLANLLVYPWMATYLQLVALRESSRYRAVGAPDRAFRVVSTLGQLSVRTEKFDRLDRMWRAAVGSPAPPDE